MNITLALMLAGTVLFFLVPLIRLATQILREPKELRLIGKTAAKLKKKSNRLYEQSTAIDETVLALTQSGYPRLRLAGRLLQTWEINLAKETVAKRQKNLAAPMAKLHSALSTGDKLALNEACGKLIDEVIESKSEPLQDWKKEVLARLASIEDGLRRGDRDLWRDDTQHLKGLVVHAPANIRPTIYLLISYLEPPLRHTEVCTDENYMEFQLQSLAVLVSKIAEGINGEIGESKLIDTLGQFEKAIWHSAKPLAGATA
jgi:hypothetical protein